MLQHENGLIDEPNEAYPEVLTKQTANASALRYPYVRVEYKTQGGQVSLSEQTSALVVKLADFEAQRRAAAAEQQAVEASLRQARAELSGQAATVPSERMLTSSRGKKGVSARFEELTSQASFAGTGARWPVSASARA